MRFYFIRHGQSVNNLLWAESGGSQGRSEDPELTEAGHRQAQLLASFVQRLDAAAHDNGRARSMKRDYFGITHLYTSLMVRSVATAAYLSDALEMPFEAWPEIHETGGIYLDDEVTGAHVGQPGKPRSFFTKNFPGLALLDSISEEGWWNKPFEDEDERYPRAQRVVETLLQRHGGKDDCVAIVSHGGFYFELARVLLGISNPQSWLLMNNTGVSRFDFSVDGEVRLMYHNRTDHLPEDLIT